MKERPILFSGPMVRAILEGRKTQTRRVVNLPCNVEHAEAELTRMQPGYEDGTRPIFGIDDEPNAFSVKCPYGAPGDRLWVKETFRIFDSSEECACYDDCKCALFNGKPIYKADGNLESKWRPSIFMRRELSRITLEIEAVRVERLQEISDEDARAEGCEESIDSSGDWISMSDVYADLWTSINGAGSWDANPWVWVIQFRRVKP